MKDMDVYYQQTVDDLVSRLDKTEHQVELLTKHINLLNGVQRNEYTSVSKLFDRIHTLEGRKI